jgi:phosphopantothenoylcysteine decarboxylase/phosphopantothenate--cysteine ligase
MKGREIVLGVCGGIAAYKTAMLTSKLVQRGAGVTVVMTAAAEKFIGRATFAALTGRQVVTEAIDPEQSPLGPHIDLAERGEVLCIAPATANFLASAAHGLAGDALTTLYLAFTGRVLVAPAMNAAMWDKPAVQRNVQQLRDDGITIIGPGEGWQSCRRSGAGRMSEPEEILAVIEAAWSGK